MILSPARGTLVLAIAKTYGVPFAFLGYFSRPIFQSI